MIGIESRELLAAIRAALADELEGHASYRDRCAEEYPEDHRNERAALELRELAAELRGNAVYDDTPALRTLLKLVTRHNLEPEIVVPLINDEFDASRFRFNNPTESGDDFLQRYVNAVEAGFEEVDELETRLAHIEPPEDATSTDLWQPDETPWRTFTGYTCNVESPASSLLGGHGLNTLQIGVLVGGVQTAERETGRYIIIEAKSPQSIENALMVVRAETARELGAALLTVATEADERDGVK